MVKRFFKRKLLLFLSLMLSVQGFAITVGYLEYGLDTGTKTATVRGCSEKASGDIEILSSITVSGIKYTVTSIVKEAFKRCTGLTSVTIPNSVISIGEWAFSYCSGLTSVTIPNSVTQIGKCAFSGCSGLTSVTIPNSVTSIGSYAFNHCTGLTSIKVDSDNSVYNDGNGSNCIIETKSNTLIMGCKTTIIPNSVTSIGMWSFEGCHGLTSVAIPNSVTSIGYGAFYYCTGLTSLTISNSVTSIGERAFEDCTGLTSLTIPNSVTQIGKEAFYGCTGLTSLTIPNGVTYIGSNAFYSCTGLTSITIPNSVTSIGSEVFGGCSGLTSVTIPNSVTSIGEHAFYDCTGLKSVTIPNSVTSIGSEVFGGCSCVIICNNLTPPTAKDDAFNSNMMAIVPSSVADNYRTARGWEKMKINAPKYYETTPSSITLIFPEFFSEESAVCDGKTFQSTNDTIVISGLKPNTSYTINIKAIYNDITMSSQMELITSSIYPTINVRSATNTSLSITGVDNAGDAEIARRGFEGYEAKDSLALNGLIPGKEYSFTYYVETSDGQRFTVTQKVKTKEITLSVSAQKGPTSLVLNGSYGNIDATITDSGFEGYPGKNVVELYGLDPGTFYNFTYYVVSEEGGKQRKEFSFTTAGLTMTSLSPKVVKEGNVIVAATTNLDDHETNVGFEWRRTDWTDDFASNTGSAVIYKGQIEGYIRNVNANYLWRVRPYYLSNSGMYYYGDWIGMDPSNTSYFDPTVHTYDEIEVKGNTALLKGYALNGTDKVTVQGFKYWKSTVSAKDRNASPLLSPVVPSDAVTVEATGQVMTASLTDLAYSTTYNYVAFVTTSEGDTFYGEIATFTTEEDPTARLKGDVNEDEKVDISDIVAVINQMAGSMSYRYSDVNGDNKTDISDIVAIINEIASH